MPDDRGRVGAAAARGQPLGDALVAGRARDAVDEADAVEEHGAGEGAQQDVLQAGLVAQPVALQVAHQDVEREAQQLQRDVGRQQLARGRHQDHARAGHQQEAVVLARGARAVAHVVRREERDRHHDPRREDAEVGREVVGAEEALEVAGGVADVGDGRDQPRQRARRRRVGEVVLADLRPDQLRGEDADGRRHGDVLGDEEGEVAHQLVTPGRFTTVFASRSVNGDHQRPIASIEAISSAAEIASMGERSFRSRQRGLSGPKKTTPNMRSM